MKHLFFTICLVVFFGVSVTAQSRKNYDGFYIETNRAGKATAIFFDADDGVGCSSASSDNATITSVTWDIVPTKFTARFKTGKLSFFVPDTVANISNAERGLLSGIFAKARQVKITWRECGSGNIPDLLGVKVLK